MPNVSSVLAFILANVFVRYLISVYPYSGAGIGPMYGDYEAQRHWMEITTGLGADSWYVHGPSNNLTYWGLDYPPLTAYHSWLIGKIGHVVEPELMQLHTSRGYESPSSKIFMRTSVIVSDLLFYLPFVYLFVKNFSPSKDAYQVKSLLLLSMSPALLLIDHGHFQYNGVSLGLALASFLSILNSSHILASIFFCLSLNFKQMGLYYSTTIFFYLLGVSIDRKDITGSIARIAKIGAVVLLTFGVCWFPFLSNIDLAKQVLHRIFPVARGLFEDKVANFWCSVSPLIKFKNIVPADRLLLLSAGCTILSLLPSGLCLLFRPNKHSFVYALIAASLGYFLFSFQVHEKSILLPVLPVSMLLVIDKNQEFFSLWFQLVATFSMYPLLYKDGVAIPYVAAMVMLTLCTFSAARVGSHTTFKTFALTMSLLGICIIHTAHFALLPPSNLPDLFVMLFAIFSFLHFAAALIYTNFKTWEVSTSTKIKTK